MKSGLRGRGGAGFPTGVKWGFLPKDYQGPTLSLLQRGRERTRHVQGPPAHRARSPPNTGRHRARLLRNRSRIRLHLYTRRIRPRGQDLGTAIAEARTAGYIGTNILGTGITANVWVHRGAGAYICGEETALLESLEGKRGLPRVKPPFPATHGLYNKPTVVNNVETLANLPHIISRGPEWFASIGSPPKSTGTRIFCVSGHVKRPGNYEVPMGITFRELIYEQAGGMRSDKPLKAFIPGGASAPFLTPDHLDVKLDFESVAAAGSMLGSGGVTVMEEGTDMVWAALRLMEFFYHESCGKCSSLPRGKRLAGPNHAPNRRKARADGGP